MTVLDDFLQASVVEISRRAALAADRQPILSQGAESFDRAVHAASVVEHDLTTIGVQRELALISGDQSRQPDLAALAVQAAAEVPWVPTPRLDSDNGELVGLGLVDTVRDFGDLIVGFMLLAPGASYPEHSHPPQEIYLPISGTGHWRYGGSHEYVQLADDTLVYNNPDDLHGAVASPDDAELALYFLWA